MNMILNPVTPHTEKKLYSVFCIKIKKEAGLGGRSVSVIIYKSQIIRMIIPIKTIRPISLPNKKERYSPIELNSNINPQTSLKNLIHVIFAC